MSNRWGSDSKVLDFMFTPFPACVKDGNLSIICVYRNGKLTDSTKWAHKVLGLTESYPGAYNTVAPIHVAELKTLIVLKFQNHKGPIVGVIIGDHYLHANDELNYFMNAGVENAPCKLVDLYNDREDDDEVIQASLAQLLSFMTDIVTKEIDESLIRWNYTASAYEGVNYIKGLNEMTLTLKIIERCANRFAFIYKAQHFAPSIAFTLENIADIRDTFALRAYETPAINPVLLLAKKLGFNDSATSYVKYLKDYSAQYMTDRYSDDITASEQNILYGLA